MKLLLLLLPISLFAQVTIPDKVAKFYLERHEIAKYLEKENVLLKEGLATLEKQIKGKDFVIQTFEEDAKTYSEIILLERKKTEACDEYKSKLEKDLIKQRRRTRLISIVGGVAIVIALIL